jgi:hypothetical protein
MEELKDIDLGAVSLDPFVSANMDAGMKETLIERFGQDDWLKDFIGKPIKIHPDSTICGEYKLGKLLGAGGFGAVFEAEGNPGLVIKSENCFRSQDLVLKEIELQNAVAKGGYSCPIIAYEDQLMDKFLYGREPQDPQRFVNLVMPKLDFSLEDIL